MRKYLASVEPALLFLLEVTSSRAHRRKLEQLKGHQEVVAFASERGYDVTRDTLAEAMKILVDRKLERDGIPSWVRTRFDSPAFE